jgi:hypothetical protein
MQTLIGLLLTFVMACFLEPAFALEGESIVFNPATGNYLITYKDSLDEKFHQVTFIPATKINPSINCKLELEKNGGIHYGYTLASGLDGQQDILLLIFDPVSSIASDITIPPVGEVNGDMNPAVLKAITDNVNAMSNIADSFDTPSPWRASMAPSDVQNAFRVGWSIKVANGMHPGNQAIFGFKSIDLPGIIQAEVTGYAPGSKKIPGEETQDAEDGGFGQQYTELVFRKNFVSRPAAVPMIAVPSPFDPAVTLERIQTQMHTWIAKQLIDPAFATQLDRNFQSAVDAYRNQGQAGNGQIGKMLALLVQQYEELERGDEELVKKKSAVTAQIDKLAALVLYFDLKYVMQRASGGN